MSSVDEALKLVDTFLSAFYHEEDDLVGTTRALQVIDPKPEYRRELGYAFKLLLEQETPPGTLRNLVRESANRNVSTDQEAREYLDFIFHDTLLNFEIDYKDE